jgi:hypothetical protein
LIHHVITDFFTKVVHLWQTRLQKLFFGKEISYDMMNQTLQNPIWVIVYITHVKIRCDFLDCKNPHVTKNDQIPLEKWKMTAITQIMYTIFCHT